MQKSNQKLVTEELIHYLEFGFAEFLIHRVSLDRTRKIMLDYVKQLQERERQHIIEAFHTGAEYGPKCPDQLETLASLYYNVRFPENK